MTSSTCELTEESGANYSFGTTLKALRRRRGMSQRALGQAIGLHQQAISQFELEQVWPSLPTLFGLAAAMGVDVTDLFRWEPDPDDDFAPVEEVERHGARKRARAMARLAALPPAPPPPPPPTPTPPWKCPGALAVSR